MPEELKPVEGYNMFIWEHDDGTVSYTGSFNASEWEDYTSRSKAELAEGVTVPDPEATNADTNADLNASSVEEPAGNASKDEWREFALAQGASEDEVADLSRNDLRDRFGSSKSEEG